MTKRKEDFHFIDFPVFGYRIIICYTADINKSRDTLKTKLGRMKNELGKNVDGLHSYHKDDPDGFIFFTRYSSIGTITHEISHALWQMFKYYGAKLENEIFAYHLGYTVDEVLKFKNKIDESSNNSKK